MAHRHVGIVTVSDRVSAGIHSDRGGDTLSATMRDAGWEVHGPVVVPDEIDRIVHALCAFADDAALPLVLTTGGTGLTPRDVTPEATRAVGERDVPGIAEALRAGSLAVTPHAMLSRAVAVTRGSTLIVNLPGNPKGAGETLAILLPVLDHAVRLVGERLVADREHRGEAP